MGYDQNIVPDTVAVEPTFVVVFFVPTTFLEIAVKQVIQLFDCKTFLYDEDQQMSIKYTLFSRALRTSTNSCDVGYVFKDFYYHHGQECLFY